MTLAELMGRRLAPDYNCAHFVCDLWQVETGEDIRHSFEGLLMPAEARRADLRVKACFNRVRRPVSPCIVLLRRARATPHVGVYVRGRVTHLADSGPIRQPLEVASLGYKSVRFYAAR